MNGNVFWFAISLLVADKRKCMALIGGVAFAVHLMTMQLGIFWGLASQTRAFVRDFTVADLWVMAPEVRFSQEHIALPGWAWSRVAATPGVDWVVPFAHSYAMVRLPDGTRTNVLLIGVDAATLLGVPGTLVHGSRDDLRQGRVGMVDTTTVERRLRMTRGGSNQPVGVGDLVELGRTELRIVGSFEGRRSFFWEPILLTTLPTMAEILQPRDRIITYLQVKVRAGHDPTQVARDITAQTGLKVYDGPGFEQATMENIFSSTGILVNFGLAVGLGFLIGALVSGQTLYSFTLERLKYYGTLRAIGTRRETIVWVVLFHALVVAALGYSLGIIVTIGTSVFIQAGGLAFAFPWSVPVGVGLSTLVMVGFGGLASVRQVLRIEPAAVFRSV